MNKLSSLKSNIEFRSLLKLNKINNNYFTIYFGKIYNQSQNKLKISFVTKKKVGNAVKRNRIKRKLKSAVIQNINKLTHIKNYGYLIIARNKVYEEKFRVLNEKINETFCKIEKIIN